MLGAVILVLREVLEAALIISLLLALTHQLNKKSSWLVPAFIGGFSGSGLLAHYAYPLADAYDGTGQEWMNTGLFMVVIVSAVIISVLLVLRTFSIFSMERERAESFILQTSKQMPSLLFGFLCALAVSCAIAREGSEIWIYLASFINQPELVYPALLGGAIGAGIGLSLGALAYYFFLFMPIKIFLPTFVVTTLLIVGGLAMQIAKELMQIGVLNGGQPMWDSSWLINERSLWGELLYALLGYEAKPTGVQGFFYALAIAPVIGACAWGIVRKKKRPGSHEKTRHE